MTKSKFFVLSGKAVGFEISGHTGFAEEGTDIVCSAVSSAVQMVVNSLSGIRTIKSNLKTLEGSVFFRISYDLSVPGSDIAVFMIESLRSHLNSISKKYPDNVSVEEVEV